MEIAKRRTLLLTDFPRMLYFETREETQNEDTSAGLSETQDVMKGEILMAQVRAVKKKSDVQYDHSTQKEMHLGSFDVITNV